MVAISKTSPFSKKYADTSSYSNTSVAYPFTNFLADVLDADVGLILDASFHLF